MTFICYEDRKFQGKTEAVIKAANGIIREYQGQGFILTLRQLYYQFVSRDLIPNNDREYKKLGETITAGRMAGKISWDAIEDRNRAVLKWPINDEDTLISELGDKLMLDLMDGQENYVEVWVEKDALSSVVGRACVPTRTPYMACKGYLSASEAWRAGRRMRRARIGGLRPVVIHLGDHDPSGIDMTRDNQERLSLFAGGEVEVRRIALNMDQVERYSPPENPTKLTDARADGYIERFGYSCWELDALEPTVLVALIEKEIGTLIDADTLHDKLAEENDRAELLRKLSENWTDVKDYLDTL